MHATSAWSVTCDGRNTLVVAGGAGWLTPKGDGVTPPTGQIYEVAADLVNNANSVTRTLMAPPGTGDLKITNLTCDSADLASLDGTTTLVLELKTFSWRL